MKVKMIWIPKTGKIETITQDTNYDKIRKKLEVRVIDMVRVGESEKNPNVCYDFILDDEGMLVDNPRENINNFSITGYQMGVLNQPFFGNILMCAIDETTGDYSDKFDVYEAKSILKKLWFL